MPLEATYIIIDSSEHTRNGDFSPNRFDAQIETISLLSNAKTSDHPESTVGLMTMSGQRPEVLVTLGNDPTLLSSCLSRVNINGFSDVKSAIQVAQLALKHRQNKNGGQRIVLFVASPLCDGDENSFRKIGLRLKKNNIAMDIVALLGAEEEKANNRKKLEALHKAVDKDNSNLIVLEPSWQVIADVLISGPLFGNGGFGDVNGGAGGAAGNQEVMMVDPNMDPELALAIQMSLQEEEERKKKKEGEGSQQQQKEVQQDDDDELDMMDEETRRAIELSMSVNDKQKANDDQEDEDEEEKAAILLSKQLVESANKEKEQVQQAMSSEFVSSLFGSLPGVDMQDEQIQNALKNIKKDEENKKDDKKKDDKKKDDKKKDDKKKDGDDMNTK